MLVELTAAAQSDVSTAALWYEGQRSGLGFRFEVELDRTFERISTNAIQFPEVTNGVRRALVRVFPFSIFFLLLDEKTRVFAVLHQHRHPKTWKRRLRK